MAEQPGPRGWWQTIPGILTAIAAVISAIAALIVGLHQVGVFDGRGDGGERGGGNSQGEPKPIPPSPPAPSGQRAGAGASVEMPCPEVFRGIPPQRTAQLEHGAEDVKVIAESDPKEGPIGLVFTDGGTPVGAMRLRYLPANDLFALEALVDAGCSAVTDYRDVERPGAPRDRIANYTTLRMRLGGRTYLLDLGGGSDIRFDFVREGP